MRNLRFKAKQNEVRVSLMSEALLCSAYCVTQINKNSSVLVAVPAFENFVHTSPLDF
jgi:hypothetical protein